MDHCGFCVAHTLHDAYSFIKALQHRGREAAGIAAVANGRIDVLKWKGPVDSFDLGDLHKIFPMKLYHSFLAHVRYATQGRKEWILEDAHPHIVGGTVFHHENHIVIQDCDAVIVHNGQIDSSFIGSVQSPMLRTDCDTERLLHFYLRHGEEALLREVPGSYSLALAEKKRSEVLVLRDRTGIKPAVLGYKDGKYCAASEDIAFRRNGAVLIETITPGSVYAISPEGTYQKRQIVSPQQHFCFFEYNYVADRESTLDGLSVHYVREKLGEALADQPHLDDVNIVSYLPRCPEFAARRFAEKIGKPFVPIFYKRQSERAFLGSTPDEREESIHKNLYIIPSIIGMLKGKTVALVDDSTVRGNNARYARDILASSGVKKIYLLNYTPPIGILGDDSVPRGCLYGVDMPPEDSFIARERSLKDISDMLCMDVRYLTLDRMLDVYKTLGVPKERLCFYCLGGEKPF